jgi:hypothetical protein
MISEKFFSEDLSLIAGLSILIFVAIYERQQIFLFFGSGH